MICYLKSCYKNKLAHPDEYIEMEHLGKSFELSMGYWPSIELLNEGHFSKVMFICRMEFDTLVAYNK